MCYLIHFAFQVIIFNKLTGSANLDILNYSEPKFSGPIENATVPVGRDVVLTCKVHDLMAFKVAWLRVDTQTILTIQNHVITKNHRIAISHTEHRIWQLRIRDVAETDRGWYMCQINTDPMKSQVGYLDVVVPPDIIDYETSHDIAIAEGNNVTLTCSASGLPPPVVVWRREKEKTIYRDEGGGAVYSVEGRTLTLAHVTREHMGAYMCIASNGVPPTVSKRVLLVINFQPHIWTKYDILYVSPIQNVILECISESYPTSVNYWLKDKEFIQGGTYETMTLQNVFKIVMKLIIRPIKQVDFGDYKCIAKNALGQSERTISVLRKDRRNQRPSQVQKKDAEHSTVTRISLENDITTSETIANEFNPMHIYLIMTLYLCTLN